MNHTILAAGDYFVRAELLVNALRAKIRDNGGGVPPVRTLTLPWPSEPFGPVSEVNEASGTEEELLAALDGVEVCVTQMAPFTERVLSGAPQLRLVAVSRGGPVNVNLQAATALGVRVCYAPGRNATATAEYTIGLIVAALRRIPETHASLAVSHTWKGEYYSYENCGYELEDAVVGLVGYGAVGSRVARVLNAFGARVLVYDPYVEPDTVAGVAEPVGTLDELLSRALVLSLHARVTEGTKGLIGAREIGLMPRGAVLVNCARGALLDYDALCDALDSGHLFAAGLDVFDTEPPSADSRLFRTPNLVLTPHLAGASRAVAERAAQMVAAEVGRYMRGEPLAHCLNPGSGDHKILQGHPPGATTAQF